MEIRLDFSYDFFWKPWEHENFCVMISCFASMAKDSLLRRFGVFGYCLGGSWLSGGLQWSSWNPWQWERTRNYLARWCFAWDADPGLVRHFVLGDFCSMDLHFDLTWFQEPLQWQILNSKSMLSLFILFILVLLSEFVDLPYHDLSICPVLSPFFWILFSLWIAPLDCRFQPWSRVVNTTAMHSNKRNDTQEFISEIWGYLADQEVVLVPAFLVSQLCIWPFMESISQVADALVFSYRAGSGGYLGIGAMVSERTGLFQVDCVGGPQGFTPFTHHPPKLTQMLVYLNEWLNEGRAAQAVKCVESCRIAGFEFGRCIILPSGCHGSCWQFGHVSSLGPPKSPEPLQRSSAAMLQKDTKKQLATSGASMKDRLH